MCLRKIYYLPTSYVKLIIHLAITQKRTYYEDTMCMPHFVYHTHLEALEAESNDPGIRQLEKMHP